MPCGEFTDYNFPRIGKVVAEKWMKKPCMSHVSLFFFSLKSSKILHISVEFSPINVSRLDAFGV